MIGPSGAAPAARWLASAATPVSVMMISEVAAARRNVTPNQSVSRDDQEPTGYSEDPVRASTPKPAASRRHAGTGSWPRRPRSAPGAPRALDPTGRRATRRSPRGASSRVRMASCGTGSPRRGCPARRRRDPGPGGRAAGSAGRGAGRCRRACAAAAAWSCRRLRLRSLRGVAVRAGRRVDGHGDAHPEGADDGGGGGGEERPSCCGEASCASSAG